MQNSKLCYYVDPFFTFGQNHIGGLIVLILSIKTSISIIFSKFLVLNFSTFIIFSKHLFYFLGISLNDKSISELIDHLI